MSKQTDNSHDKIRLVSEDLLENPPKNVNKSNNVIKDKEDSLGFDVDWDTIEENYRNSQRHRHHRHRHSSHNHEHSHNSIHSSKKTSSRKSSKTD